MKVGWRSQRLLGLLLLACIAVLLYRSIAAHHALPRNHMNVIDVSGITPANATLGVRLARTINTISHR